VARCVQILIVEDDPNIREVLKQAVEFEGYTCTTAEDGQRAYAQLQTMKEPCLILLDLMMPNMNGYEFIELASKTHTVASIPVVVVSAAADASKLKTVDSSGQVKGLIKKPVELESLMATVREWCGEPKPR